MITQPAIAIVLLNYNGKKYLEKNLPFIEKISYPGKKVYVIDNCSTDDSLPFLQSNYPQFTIIKNEKNLGYAAGYNAGLVNISADYFVLLNTDVEVTSHFLEPIIGLMETDKNIGICQPKILSYSNRNLFEYAGGAGGYIDLLGYTFANGRLFDSCEEDNGQYKGNHKIFWASGACMVVRSSLFRTLNGFYDYFFMYAEEVDLCWRAQSAGNDVVVCGDVAVYHKETTRLLHQSPGRIYFVFRNNLVMLHRNLPVAAAIPLLFIRLLLNMLSAVFFLIKGHAAAAASVLKANLHYLEWVFFTKKTPVNKKRSLRKMDTVYKGSILFQYFILRKKKIAGKTLLQLQNTHTKQPA